MYIVRSSDEPDDWCLISGADAHTDIKESKNLIRIYQPIIFYQKLDKDM